MLIQAIYKTLIARRKINNSLHNGINYRLNNKIEELQKIVHSQ